MGIEETKYVEIIEYVTDVNEYLKLGWTLLLTYVDKDVEYSKGPYFVLAWQKGDEPKFPKHIEHREVKEFHHK